MPGEGFPVLKVEELKPSVSESDDGSEWSPEFAF